MILWCWIKIKIDEVATKSAAALVSDILSRIYTISDWTVKGTDETPMNGLANMSFENSRWHVRDLPSA
jgi:hypothetical protein